MTYEAILEYITPYNLTVVIFCYFQKENHKVLKFHVNNSYFFQISLSFKRCPPINTKGAY